MFSENSERQTALGSAEKAKDPYLTDHELAQLARSEEVKVRAVVGERVETPLTALVRLAGDSAASVRASVARNPRMDLPIEVRAQLAQDKSPEVLHALIRCATVPDAILQKLARSWNRDVAVAAKAALKNNKRSTPAAVVMTASPALGQIGLASS